MKCIRRTGLLGMGAQLVVGLLACNLFSVVREIVLATPAHRPDQTDRGPERVGGQRERSGSLRTALPPTGFAFPYY